MTISHHGAEGVAIGRGEDQFSTTGDIDSEEFGVTVGGQSPLVTRDGGDGAGTAAL